MKELSIEEKAKAYDEARSRMSRAFNNNRCTIGFMNEIFPELAKSENERIKKAIKYGLDYVFTNNTTVYETTKEQCLAWLEKQGEQKPAEWSYYDEIIIGTIIQEIEKIPSEKFIDNAKYRCLDWLRYRTKSLKPQSQWKPSNEQFELLKHIIKNVPLSHRDKSEVWDLYLDLKRLEL